MFSGFTYRFIILFLPLLFCCTTLAARPSAATPSLSGELSDRADDASERAAALPNATTKAQALTGESGKDYPIDPGRDPESERKRRMRPIGIWGSLSALFLFAFAALLSWRFSVKKRPVPSGLSLAIASAALVWLAAELLLHATVGNWAMHVKVRSNCYHDNPRGYFKLSHMADHPEISAWCVDGMEAVWAECAAESFSKNRDKLRILALGDSFTDAVGVFRRDTWPRKLEALLADGGGHVKKNSVTNCGKSGFDSFQVARRLETSWERHRPNVVIYAFVLNDVPARLKPFAGNPAYVGFQVEDRVTYSLKLEKDPLWGGLTGNSAVLRLFAERWIQKRIEESTVEMHRDTYSDPAYPKLVAAFDSIRKMQGKCDVADARFLVALLPFFYRFEDYPFRAAHDLIKSELEARGLAVLDLLPLFEGKDASRFQVHSTDFHPNEIAHEMIARSIAEELVRRGWADEPK